MASQIARSRSSKLTGGEGFTYEDLVVAYYLTALLREETAMGTRGRVVRVAVQQNRQGEPMDDLVVDAEDGSEPARTSLQVKSNVVISHSNAEFQAIIAEAVATRRKLGFKVDRDRYGFVAETVAVGRFDGLSNIIARAVASTNGTEFISRFVPGGESSASDIALRKELQSLIRPAGPDEEWDFYRHLVAYRFDNLAPGGDRYADLTNRLSEIASSGGANFAEVLARHVRGGEGSARVWKRNELIREMRNLVTLRIAPIYAPDIAIITDFAKNAITDIRDDIAGFSVDRSTFVSAAENAAKLHVLTNISGLPGCGKSVVLRRCVERAIANGPVLFLTSDRLEGSTWRSFANHHGLTHHSAAALLGEIGGAGTSILFIDGLDRIKPENRGIITDLLHAIEREPELSHWHVLVTSRDQGLEVLRSWIPASLYATGGLGNVNVDALNDDEAKALAEKRPALAPLLFGAAAVSEIARRPFFAAVLANQASTFGFDKGPPQTENELIDAWWRAGGYKVEVEAADARQRAMLDLAEKGASSLGKDILGRSIKPETVTQLEGLRRDKIVDNVEAGSSYKFTHDIFFEWAFFRLLIDKRDEWPDALVSAGEPPLLTRIVGLLSQRDYEQNRSWDTTFATLNALALRSQWRRAWLLGPSASSRFLEHRAVFEALTSRDEHTLLEKFLVWFQAERTIPSPIILQKSNTEIESSVLVRAADLLGWPSDITTWQRVLLWLCARHALFPAKSIPHVVELFKVWQNMGADLPNTISEKLISICEKWLVDLETKNGEQWESLKGDTHASLAEELRKLILRAARAYPDPAGRALDRMMKWKHRSDRLLKSVFGLSIVLAQTFPEKLAQLVRIEVLVELPKDKQDRERREREAHFAHLQAAREKSEDKRTASKKRMLAPPNIFHSISSDRYDYNHIGIEHGYNLFYPAAPSHEPFESLFQSAPDEARALVRDIANHAMTGWRQIHEINRQQYGTLIPIEIDFPWGRQTFWGNQRSYSWYFGEGGPPAVEAAFLALMQWAHRKLDEGEDLDELIRQVTEGHESVAALGLAVSLAIERKEPSTSLRTLLTCQRLWVYDFVRQMQEGMDGINLFGFNPTDRMNAQQKAGYAYLKSRDYRHTSLKDLAFLYALSNDESERNAFITDIATFPANLPYEIEEQIGQEAFEAKIRERAQAWAEFANKDNYQLAKVPGNEKSVQVVYHNPTAMSEDRQAELEESTKWLQDFRVTNWATQVLNNGVIEAQPTIEEVLAFARTRDEPSLLLKIDEAGTGTQQAGVAACAAVAIQFGSTTENLDWAWSVIDRLADMHEEDDPFRYSKKPRDPRNYYLVALKRDLESASPRSTSAPRLLTMAAHPNPYISQMAFICIFNAQGMPEALVWNAGILASELFVTHFHYHPTESDEEDKKARLHREAALARAIARLRAPDPAVTFFAPPPPWICRRPKPHERIRDGENEEIWSYPEFAFNPQYAAEVLKQFPIEAWAKSNAHRDRILTFARQLVSWTAERIFPSSASKKEDKSSYLYEWLDTLATVVARIIVYMPTDADALALVETFAKHYHRDVLQFTDDLTDQLTRRFVYDAVELPERVLMVLDMLMTRMFKEQDFSSTSYRAGEIRDRHLSSMIRSFLLVSAKDCPGAARFANGNWDDLPLLLPQINRLMAAAGWVDEIMDSFLTLSKRAATRLPIEDFERIVSASMDADGFRLERWNAAGIPASISGTIQGLADANYPLTREQARGLLVILDRLVDIGDRRAAALQQSEHFRGIQVDTPKKEAS